MFSVTPGVVDVNDVYNHDTANMSKEDIQKTARPG